MSDLSDSTTDFIFESVNNEKLEFSANRQVPVDGNVRRTIFQGDSLSPLIFCFGWAGTVQNITPNLWKT